MLIEMQKNTMSFRDLNQEKNRKEEFIENVKLNDCTTENPNYLKLE
jgi:hypothetical protein